MSGDGALEVVERYYDAFDRHEEGWRELVAEDVSFVGPLQQGNGVEEFTKITEQFLRMHKHTKVLNRVAQEDEVISVYEFTLGTPSGGTMTCDVAEVARVSDGKIAETKIYYDPRKLAREFGL